MVEVTTASPKYLGANGLRRVPAEARSRWAVVSATPSWKAWRGGRGGTPDRLGARVGLCGSRTKPVRRLERLSGCVAARRPRRAASSEARRHSAVGIRHWSQHSARSGGCGLVAGDADQNVVTQRGIDVDVEAQVGDPAVSGVPVTVCASATEKRVQGVDRGFPEAEPVAHAGRQRTQSAAARPGRGSRERRPPRRAPVPCRPLSGTRRSSAR